jgi:hypothetical protein
LSLIKKPNVILLSQVPHEQGYRRKMKLSLGKKLQDQGKLHRGSRHPDALQGSAFAQAQCLLAKFAESRVALLEKNLTLFHLGQKHEKARKTFPFIYRFLPNTATDFLIRPTGHLQLHIHPHFNATFIDDVTPHFKFFIDENNVSYFAS